MRQGRRGVTRAPSGRFLHRKGPIAQIAVQVNIRGMVHRAWTAKLVDTRPLHKVICVSSVKQVAKPTLHQMQRTAVLVTQAAFPQERHIFVRSARLAPSAPLDRKAAKRATRANIQTPLDPAAVLHVQLVDIRQARMEVAVLNAPLVASKVRRAWPRVSSVLQAPTLKEQEVSCVPSAKALSTR
mgnify:CR=1 FL=1|jgi:hypothetical protein